VAKTRHDYAGGKSAGPQRGPQAKMRARERLAAERAARKRAEARRRLLVPIVAVTAVLAIVFVSEESCPFCAAERWSVAVALSHFGTLSHLGTTRSSATDVYPNTATLSFRTVRYQSTELTLRTTELADNAGRPLQPQTGLDTRLTDTFDVPPYVNSADQSGAVPFLGPRRGSPCGLGNNGALRFRNKQGE
jgi:Domain of unknown function (DUF929)